MQNYIVFMPGGDRRIEQQFPSAHYRIAEGLWAVGSDLMTSSEVCRTLGVDEPQTMVVVPMSDYYGRYDRALWQQLESWSRR